MASKLIYVLLIALMIPCLKRKHLEILEATKQITRPGREESSEKTHYHILLKVFRDSEKMHIGSIWIDSYEMTPTIRKTNSEELAGNFQKGDSLRLDFTIFKNRTPGQNPGKKIPEYSGEAMIQFHFKGKSFYQEITEFMFLPTIEER